MSIPLQIVPFPDGTQFIKNDINITVPVWDPNDKDKIYDHAGTYNISASSYYDNTTMPFLAFNGNKDAFWKSNTTANNFIFSPSITPYTTTPYLAASDNKTMSTYQGGGALGSNFYSTNVTGGTGNPKQVNGEWLQIQLPKPMNVYMYSVLTPESQGSVDYFPTEFSLVGSLDGVAWYYIHHQEYQSALKIGDRKPISFKLTNPVRYSYFRLIIMKMPVGNSMVRINQLNLFGLPHMDKKADKKESFVGEMNRQYSPYNLYPSLNLFTPFSISEPMSVRGGGGGHGSHGGGGGVGHRGGHGKNSVAYYGNNSGGGGYWPYYFILPETTYYLVEESEPRNNDDLFFTGILALILVGTVGYIVGNKK